MQSNMASAQVVLGHIPATLVFVGPTIAEITALSTYRPLLAVLLALGSPAINVSRIFSRIDVCEPFLRQKSKTSRLWSGWLARHDLFFRVLWRCLSYASALAALVINVRNSVYTDYRTISGWRCGALFMPFVWSLLAVVVHV